MNFSCDADLAGNGEDHDQVKQDFGDPVDGIKHADRPLVSTSDIRSIPHRSRSGSGAASRGDG